MPDRRVVIDASAMVDLLLADRVGVAVGQAIAGATLHAPPHFDVEVLSALARLQRSGELTVEHVEERLARLRDAPVERHPAADLLEPAWRLRHNVRVTDGLYVALAEALDAEIVTTDRALARAVPGRTRLPVGLSEAD